MATKSVIHKHLTCSICLELFKSPKTLPCLHNFCESCLTDHILAANINDDCEETSFNCPLCRAKTTVDRNCHQSHLASSFPTNHFIVSLLEDEALKNNAFSTENEKNSFVCTPCHLEETQAEAFCFCINCNEYYCKRCYEDHRKFKLTRSHQILKGNDMPANLSVFEKVSKLGMCDVHSEKEIEFQCTKHNLFLCSVCATTKHRKCKNIVHIGGNTEEKQMNTEDCSREILPLQKEIEALLESKLTEADRVGNLASKVERYTQEIKRELRQVLQKLETMLERNISRDIADEKKRLSSDISELLGIHENLRESDEVIKIICEHGTGVQKQVLLDWIKKKKSEIRSSIDSKWNNQESLKEFGVSIEQEVMSVKNDTLQRVSKLFEQIHIPVRQNTQYGQAINKEPQLSSRGVLVNEACSISETDVLVAKGKDSSMYPKKSSIRTNHSRLDCSFQKVAEHDISVPKHSTKQCNHNASVLLIDGNMVFIDNNNHLLKLVSKTFKVQCYERLAAKPRDLCSLAHGRIAVAVPGTVLVFQVGRTFTKHNYFPLGSTLLVSLCSAKENTALLLQDCDEDCEYIIEYRDDEFEVVDTIDKLESFHKTVNLYNVKQIRSRYRNEVLVCTPKKIIAFERNGHQKWWFTSPDLKHANYMTFDQRDNIYVSDLETGTVYQIAASSYNRNRVILNSIRRPASMVFDETENSLIIGCFDDNNVYVYHCS